jgi:hypothetical protein
MKKSIYLNLFVMLAIFLAACTNQFFLSANSMRNTFGTVYMSDGSVLTGYLSVNASETPRYSRDNYITFREKLKGPKQHLYVRDIEQFSIRGNFYAPIETDLQSFSRKTISFARRVTDEKSRIQLYEIAETRQRQGSNGAYYAPDYVYYVRFPFNRKYEAWRIDGQRFVPNFEDKMSDYVRDNRLLSEKIKNKEKGYFYSMLSLSLEKRLETIQRIIDEYNSTP